MSKIRTFSPFTLIVTFVCLSLVGLALLPLLPVKLSPSRTLPGLTVSFTMPGNSSRVIEAEVTSRLEAMLSRVKGVKGVNSTSDNGSGSITLEMDKHADMDATRFEVSTIIRQTWPQLPEGVSYPQIHASRSNNNAERPFMTYTLNATATVVRCRVDTFHSLHTAEHGFQPTGHFCLNDPRRIARHHERYRQSRQVT